MLEGVSYDGRDFSVGDTVVIVLKPNQEPNWLLSQDAMLTVCKHADVTTL